MTAGRLILLVTSPRVAAGLLTAQAWDALRTNRVLAAAADHPQPTALAAEGITVEEFGPPEPRALLDAAAGGGVVWLGSPDGDPGLTDGLAAEVARRTAQGGPAPEIEILAGSYDLPGARLLDLVAVMDRLRSPGGCPWDREQTHRSLATYLIEEAYETLEAIESDPDHLREELGDLLLQVVFHARIAEEQDEDAYSIDDVAGGIVDKLIRRHPHVFGDADAPTAAHVESRWDELKTAEKGRSSALEGIPAALPALALAAKSISRATRAGVAPELPNVDPELPVGELLLAVAARAHRDGLDAEQELRDAVRRFAEDVRARERDA
ncbi:MAG TPA: MazG family protein [Jiangellaceae bacterium]|nr:MazG family protein [Jiangellaceae bacterium]